MLLCSASREDRLSHDIHDDGMAIMRSLLHVSVTHLYHLVRLCQTPSEQWTKEDSELFSKAQSFVQDYLSKNGKKEP
jgi:hypothetical protein